MATTPKVVTYEEWLRMPVVDGREEVVNGEIRIMPPNKLPHPRIIQKLISSFLRHIDEEKVDIIGSTFGLVIRKDPLTCRNPDLALFRKDRIVERDGYFHSPPELVIEVLSASDTRAEPEERLRDYEEIGVPEVWVMSSEARTVEVLHLIEGKLRTVNVVMHGQLHPVHFPEAAVDVDSIWPSR